MGYTKHKIKMALPALHLTCFSGRFVLELRVEPRAFHMLGIALFGATFPPIDISFLPGPRGRVKDGK